MYKQLQQEYEAFKEQVRLDSIKLREMEIEIAKYLSTKVEITFSIFNTSDDIALFISKIPDWFSEQGLPYFAEDLGGIVVIKIWCDTKKQAEELNQILL